MKRQGPILLAFLTGLVMIIQFFTPAQVFKDIYNWMLDCKQVVLGFTFILGTASLVRYHLSRIQRKRENWEYSYVTLLGLLVTVVSAIIWKTASGPYPWLFENVQVPMQSTMFSLLAFFVASASYRAFRARSFHATLLLAAGALVMLGRVPIGAYLAGKIFGVKISLVSISDWLLNVPNAAAKRGIMIGVGLGMTATAIKIVLGIEQTYLGKTD